MMSFNDVFRKMKSLNKIEKKTIIEKALKLNEETGELSAEILKLKGFKGSNGKNYNQVKNEAVLEVADIMIVLMSICVDLEISVTDILKSCDKKIKCYESKLKRQNTWGFDK
jgi:NTP pyrophosphatase (non-canonical NTP hydrolase)